MNYSTVSCLTNLLPNSTSRNWLTNFFRYFPELRGLPLPTTPSTKRVRAGQLERNERKGLDNPKASLLQNQFNRSWNVAPKGATRGGVRNPDAHYGRVQKGKAKTAA